MNTSLAAEQRNATILVAKIQVILTARLAVQEAQYKYSGGRNYKGQLAQWLLVWQHNTTGK